MDLMVSVFTLVRFLLGGMQWMINTAGRQLLPRFSYQGFDPCFQTGGYKTGHFNHLKSALFLYLVWKLSIHTVSKISYY